MKRKLPLLMMGFFLSAGALAQSSASDVDVAGSQAVKPSANILLAQTEDVTAQDPVVWVFRHRRPKQCVGKDMTLAESSAKLKDSGVVVHGSACGFRTDVVFVSSCGEPTGQILLHLIRASALETALDLDYGPAEQVKYQRVECPDKTP
ncbi:hypothetical protein [Microbulbifer aggregans]|uniref:hypothetical protein n=1 Tax=Microbulbifer aggregans TaxID=1769779 RepID=UPI001CFD5F67|nr:hypothetical protein [Microbulbifer aggregans]